MASAGQRAQASGAAQAVTSGQAVVEQHQVERVALPAEQFERLVPRGHGMHLQLRRLLAPRRAQAVAKQRMVVHDQYGKAIEFILQQESFEMRLGTG